MCYLVGLGSRHTHNKHTKHFMFISSVLWFSRSVASGLFELLTFLLFIFSLLIFYLFLPEHQQKSERKRHFLLVSLKMCVWKSSYFISLIYCACCEKQHTVRGTEWFQQFLQRALRKIWSVWLIRVTRFLREPETRRGSCSRVMRTSQGYWRIGSMWLVTSVSNSRCLFQRWATAADVECDW